MARLINNIHGPFRGKLSNVTGTFWKGISVLRTIPENYNDANTDIQQAHRSKVKLLTSYLSQFKHLIKIGFTAADPKKSAFNNALKHNFAAIEGTFPDYRINIEKLKLSIGKLENIWDPTIQHIEPNTISLTWADNSNNETAFATDQLHVCVISTDPPDVHINTTPVTRNATTFLITLPTSWSNRNVYVIGFMVKEKFAGSKSKKDVSDSQVWKVG